MQNTTSRRAVLSGGIALITAPIAAAQAPALSPIEALMASVVPHHHPDYQVVRKADLKALCDATGVQWRSHWGNVK